MRYGKLEGLPLPVTAFGKWRNKNEIEIVDKFEYLAEMG
jgi:hypothetical protein